MNAVLPILSCLSKTFQKETNNEWTSGITTHNDFGLDESLMGLKVQMLLNKSPIDLSELMFTDDYYDLIVTRTNWCASQQREDPLNQRQPWSDLTFAEFKTWLGLYLAMEIVGKAIEEQQRENYKEEK